MVSRRHRRGKARDRRGGRDGVLSSRSDPVVTQRGAGEGVHPISVRRESRQEPSRSLWLDESPGCLEEEADLTKCVDVGFFRVSFTTQARI